MGTSDNRKMTFKRFTVIDEKCAMKIGTDSVLLGVWASPSQSDSHLKIVDIGSGSGVVALMLAQRFEHSSVIAIELEHFAAEQARENFATSPFGKQLSCVESSFQQWSEGVNNFKADLVVSNPPFFHNKPKSPFYARNLARHDDSLPISDLFHGVAKILSKDGVLAIVWPVEREGDLISAANDWNFKLVRRCEILPTKKHPPVRLLTEFKFPDQVHSEVIRSKIVLETGEKKGSRNFTAEYNELMRDFFLES